MGEPVTEEMLAHWERACDEAAQNNGREVRADVLAEDFDVPDAMRTLIAEMRRLRAALKHAVDAGESNYLAALNAEAAGYARAERDVVADLRVVEAAHRKTYETSRYPEDDIAENKLRAIEDYIERIEQGAHRGAAKEGT